MAQKFSKLALFLSICILITLLLIPKSTSTPVYLVNSCANTTTFESNSQYETNLKEVFNFLASNASNPTGFYQAVSSSGNAANTDTVYGLFLCRGELNASSCRDCVTTATVTDLPKTYCPNRKVAVIWYNECMVRYSYQSIFGILDEDPSWYMENQNNITGNITRFEQLFRNMLINEIAVQAAAGGSEKKFGASIANYTSSQKIYGMGQCTPDLSLSDCSSCLNNSIMQLKVSQGARILKPSCIVRYEIYPFFDLSSISLPPKSLSPSPPPSPLPESQPPTPARSSPSPQLLPTAAPPAPPLVPSDSTHSNGRNSRITRSPETSLSATTALTAHLNPFCAVGIYYVIMNLFVPNFLA